MLIRRLLSDTRGVTAIEYALIAALVVIAAVAGIAALGGSSSNLWQTKVATPANDAMK